MKSIQLSLQGILTDESGFHKKKKKTVPCTWNKYQTDVMFLICFSNLS